MQWVTLLKKVLWNMMRPMNKWLITLYRDGMFICLVSIKDFSLDGIWFQEKQYKNEQRMTVFRLHVCALARRDRVFRAVWACVIGFHFCFLYFCDFFSVMGGDEVCNCPYLKIVLLSSHFDPVTFYLLFLISPSP